VIYASVLKRAHQTAIELHKKQPTPQPPLIISLDLREQSFGEAEGKPWTMSVDPDKSMAELFSEGKYPILTHRSEKFPQGESLDDLGQRADRAIQGLVMPHVWRAKEEGAKEVKLAIVSHGLCVSELIPALLKRGVKSGPMVNYRGLQNTAWTRVTVTVKDSKEGEALEFPLLEMQVTHVNMHGHIDKLKRQKGGIGSSAYDPMQKDLRAFFGGGGAEAPLQEHSESNLRDEVGIEVKA